MGSKHCDRCSFVFAAVIIGVLMGALEATLWIFGLIPTVRDIIPYANANALLIFALTPILAVLAKICSCQSFSHNERRDTLWCLGSFVKVIMIAAAVFLVFVQVFIGTCLPLLAKAVLAYIGSLSFWIMLIAFLQMVFYLVKKTDKDDCEAESHKE